MKELTISDILIDIDWTIKKSMKKLDTDASRILFVKDLNGKLVGSLTDGDIRRGLLAGKSLDSSIESVFNSHSMTVQEGFDKDSLIREMSAKEIDVVPVVDKSNYIVDLFALPQSHIKIKKRTSEDLDIPVVIMAGGKGTRLEPFTNVLPKPLIPIGDKTMLEYIIDEYRKYGINDYYMTINYKGNLIKAYFEGIEKEYNVTYVEETEFLGTAGSLKLISDFPERCIVSNCDIIVRADYSDVMDFHKSNNACLTVLSSIQHHVIPYGVIEFAEGGKVTGLKEKPEFSMPINTGVYILEKEAWDYIPEKKFFHMTHLIETLIDAGKKVITYPVNENDYVDIGQWKEYRDGLKRLAF